MEKTEYRGQRQVWIFCTDFYYSDTLPTLSENHFLIFLLSSPFPSLLPRPLIKVSILFQHLLQPNQERAPSPKHFRKPMLGILSAGLLRIPSNFHHFLSLPRKVYLTFSAQLQLCLPLKPYQLLKRWNENLKIEDNRPYWPCCCCKGSFVCFCWDKAPFSAMSDLEIIHRDSPASFSQGMTLQGQGTMSGSN